MTTAHWTVIVNDECDPVLVTIIPPSTDPNNEPVIFYDYRATYGDDQRRTQSLRHKWCRDIIGLTYTETHRPDDEIVLERLVNDQEFIIIYEVTVETP